MDFANQFVPVLALVSLGSFGSVQSEDILAFSLISLIDPTREASGEKHQELGLLRIPRRKYSKPRWLILERS